MLVCLLQLCNNILEDKLSNLIVEMPQFYCCRSHLDRIDHLLEKSLLHSKILLHRVEEQMLLIHTTILLGKCRMKNVQCRLYMSLEYKLQVHYFHLRNSSPWCN